MSLLFTSLSTLHLAERLTQCIPFPILQPLLVDGKLIPMASVDVPQNPNCFLLESRSNSGVQYSRLHALSHVRFSGDGEVSNSDGDDTDDDPPPIKKILARSPRV